VSGYELIAVLGWLWQPAVALAPLVAGIKVYARLRDAQRLATGRGHYQVAERVARQGVDHSMPVSPAGKAERSKAPRTDRHRPSPLPSDPRDRGPVRPARRPPSSAVGGPALGAAR